MNNVWMVASGKGGTGKSSLVVNLSAALAMEGLRVVVVDLSVGLRCLDLCLGLDDRVLFDLIDVLSGNCRPRDAILKHSTIDNLWLLPAAQNRSMDELTEKSLDALCNQLAEQFDLVLLDCPPGLEPIPQRVSTVAGRAILVTTTEATAIRDTERLVAEFTANGLTDLYLVINRYCSEYLNNNLIPTETEIADSIGVPLLGTIPEDEAVTIATLRCEPMLIRQPMTPAGRVFTALARRLPGKDFL